MHFVTFFRTNVSEKGIKSYFLLKSTTICNIIITHKISHYFIEYISNINSMRYIYLIVEEEDLAFAALCGLELSNSIVDLFFDYTVLEEKLF